ncbi:Chondroitin sulfate N-acetylgalactosaminyltransferase 1 [Nymphon striatum]|nr:Chondroitin sulfate N-acetylgalactosaminyltransferase 1 [Nymphon striatum]
MSSYQDSISSSVWYPKCSFSDLSIVSSTVPGCFNSALLDKPTDLYDKPKVNSNRLSKVTAQQSARMLSYRIDKTAKQRCLVIPLGLVHTMKWLERIVCLVGMVCITSVFLTASNRKLENINHTLSISDVITEHSTNITTTDVSISRQRCSERFNQKELEYKNEIKRLTEQLSTLKEQLKTSSSNCRDKHCGQEEKNLSSTEEISTGQDKTRVYYRFTSDFIYGENFSADKNLRFHLGGGGLIEKDIKQSIKTALNTLNSDRKEKILGANHFFDGIYRHDPTIGSNYELNFRDNADSQEVLTVKLFRPYDSITTTAKRVRTFKKATINVVVPLSGRNERFRMFLDNFAEIAIQTDKRVFLTVVYFGQDGLQEVRHVMTNISKQNNFKKMRLLTLNETFSRARGIQVGIDYWKKGDVIIFVCDVDILFTVDFLDRCRLNSIIGERVYFPILFSQYNPTIVYNVTGKIVNINEITISKDFGFWRDIGYGMSCMFRSDFLNIGGIDYESSTWGGEDVFLYRKFTKSKLEVIRSIDPGIMHSWHDKTCFKDNLGPKYNSCIGSKALTEGSHIQLGHLLFDER